MLINKMFFRKTFITGLCGAMLLWTSATFAKIINMEPGQSQYIELDQKVDTIFVSAPDTADYEILDDYSFMIYAKQEGKTEVTAFDAEGKKLYSDTVNVNALINNISDTNQQIKTRFPNTKLKVKKIGKAYVIEGEAASQAESEEVNRIVGEALGASQKVTEYTLKRGGEFGDEKIPFLDRYQYQGVIDHSNIDETTLINVKLTVVEVNKRFSDSLGVNWSNLQGNLLHNLTSGVRIGGSFDGSNGSSSISLINADNLKLFINAVNNHNNGKILAEPNISMLSGETADILVGGEIPFAQRDREGATTIIYKDYGVKLIVGGKVQKNNRIRLALAQEVSTLAGNYVYQGIGEVPYFNTRRSKSTFEIADGESFIIGGLLSSSDAEGLSKFPLLGDIPIIGAFFRNASTSRENKELVVVATVNLVKPVNGDQIVYPDFEKTGTMERFFNVTPLKNVYHKTLTSNFLKNGGFIQ